MCVSVEIAREMSKQFCNQTSCESRTWYLLLLFPCIPYCHRRFAFVEHTSANCAQRLYRICCCRLKCSAHGIPWTTATMTRFLFEKHSDITCSCYFNRMQALRLERSGLLLIALRFTISRYQCKQTRSVRISLFYRFEVTLFFLDFCLSPNHISIFCLYHSEEENGHLYRA